MQPTLMAAPAPGAPRTGPEEQPPQPPGAQQATMPCTPDQQQQQQPGGPPLQQPSPAEQKYQPSPAQPPPAQGQQQQQQQQQQAPPATAAPQHQGQEDYSFLPLVHDIIKCIDKDSQDVHQVLNELRTKFVEVRKLIRTMQGIGVSPEHQQQQLQNLREQVGTKSDLLQKYKTLCMFEIPKE